MFHSRNIVSVVAAIVGGGDIETEILNLDVHFRIRFCNSAVVVVSVNRHLARNGEVYSAVGSKAQILQRTFVIFFALLADRHRVFVFCRFFTLKDNLKAAV